MKNNQTARDKITAFDAVLEAGKWVKEMEKIRLINKPISKPPAKNAKKF